jgi:hypothetical protein
MKFGYWLNKSKAMLKRLNDVKEVKDIQYINIIFE